MKTPFGVTQVSFARYEVFVTVDESHFAIGPTHKDAAQGGHETYGHLVAGESNASDLHASGVSAHRCDAGQEARCYHPAGQTAAGSPTTPIISLVAQHKENSKVKKYTVQLYKPAQYDAEVEVVAESSGEAKLIALSMDDVDLDWDYNDEGGDTEVRDVFECEESEDDPQK